MIIKLDFHYYCSAFAPFKDIRLFLRHFAFYLFEHKNIHLNNSYSGWYKNVSHENCEILFIHFTKLNPKSGVKLYMIWLYQHGDTVNSLQLNPF